MGGKKRKPKRKKETLNIETPLMPDHDDFKQESPELPQYIDDGDDEIGDVVDPGDDVFHDSDYR